jgi:glycosyltransferase involved in cell wall biosynthesis
MKIAIVAPCPVPYVVGGAEKLWWGLVRHMNDATEHQADIIKLPSPEADFDSLMDSYERFSQLKLDGFDCVISTKYPAWMVGHNNHVVYLQHRLRGLFDAYPADLPVTLGAAVPKSVDQLLRVMHRHREDRNALPEVFARLRRIRKEDSAAHDVFLFPGPLAREVVHFLDGVALNRRAIRRFSTIARTVALRPGYFPDGVEVTLAHHPSNLEIARGERYEYLFTASRLDVPKRVDLIVEAMRHVKADIPLLIAGVGPEDARLRRLAAHDRRIRFLGFVSDRELVRLYRDALAVPFVPWQEDYGLITTEAMMAGKPVVTVEDAGGPTEVVVDGETGRIVAATPEAVGAALQRLAADPDQARRMGAAGRLRAELITWDHVLDSVLPIGPAATAKPVAVEQRRNVPKIVVAATFPIWPPHFGGPSRVFHLYRELAHVFDVTIVTMADPDLPALDTEIAAGLREVRVPKTRAHAAKEASASARYGLPVGDAVATELQALTPDYFSALRREAKDASALVACHPYLYPLLAQLADGRPIWYEAQDIESHLKARMLPEGPDKPALLEAIVRVERACCAAAHWVFACSAGDAAVLEREFGVAGERLIVVPNGTDSHSIPFVGRDERARNKGRLGAKGVPLALFMGSGHQPNIEAVQALFETARALSGVTFVVVGNVGYAFEASHVPGNVWMLGEVSATARQIVLEAVDLALNPMFGGSGTNLKMLDYFAAGIPVISTPTGARGLPVVDGEHLFIRDADAFPLAIASLLENAEQADTLAASARSLVEREFDWGTIGGRLAARIAPSTQTRLDHLTSG